MNFTFCFSSFLSWFFQSDETSHQLSFKEWEVLKTTTVISLFKHSGFPVNLSPSRTKLFEIIGETYAEIPGLSLISLKWENR